LASTSECRLSCGSSAHTLARVGFAPCLSWDSLLGVCPAAVSTVLRPPSRPKSTFVSEYPNSLHGPSSWFLTTSTVYSAGRDPSVLQLDPTIGFATFPARPDLPRLKCVATLSLDQDDSVLPRNAVHTPRRIPLADSRTASLRPLPSCCSIRPDQTEV